MNIMYIFFLNNVFLTNVFFFLFFFSFFNTVQYPGVADSIDSDIENVMRLVRWTNFAPKGLYIDEVMRVARKELKLECDYVHEAAMQQQYQEVRSKNNFLKNYFYSIFSHIKSPYKIPRTNLLKM